MRRLALFPLLCSLWCCETPGELPGESIGRFAVVGQLKENTCGVEGLPAEDPLEFSVELRRQGQRGIWILGQPPGTTGELDDTGTFRFLRQSTHEAVAPSAAEPEQPEQYWSNTPGAPAAAGCSLVIEEEVAGQVAFPDAGANAAGDASSQDLAHLEALNRITIRPQPGGDCQKAFAVAGGPFQALPCYAEYELTGESEP